MEGPKPGGAPSRRGPAREDPGGHGRAAGEPGAEGEPRPDKEVERTWAVGEKWHKGGRPRHGSECAKIQKRERGLQHRSRPDKDGGNGPEGPEGALTERADPKGQTELAGAGGDEEESGGP